MGRCSEPVQLPRLNGHRAATVERGDLVGIGRQERSSPSPHLPRRLTDAGDRQLATAPGQRSACVSPAVPDPHRFAALAAQLVLSDLAQGVGLGHAQLVEQPGVSFVIRPLAFSVESDGYVAALFIDEDAPGIQGPRLSSTLMRDLPVGQMRAMAAASLGQLLKFVGAASLPPPKTGRRSSISDIELARLSADWVNLLKAGTPKPMEALAAMHHLSYDGMVHRKRSAVRRGLLTATDKGRAGGTLTAKALELLNAQTPDPNEEAANGI